MPYPSGTPVMERVLEHVRTTLAAISTGSGFHSTVAEVHRADGRNALDVNSYPALIVSAPSVSWDQSAPHMIAARPCSITIRCVVDDRDSRQTALSWIVSDVKAALLADVTRGGDAVSTEIVADRMYESDENLPWSAADIDVDLWFRHLRSDPNTSI